MHTIVRKTAAAAIDTWKHAFFREVNTVPLEVVRIGVGFLLLFNYGLFGWADLLALYGVNGIIALEYVPETTGVMKFSVFGYLASDFQVLVFHHLFLFFCLCLCVGWKTRWVKWLVLIAHLSYANRNPLVGYGVDNVAVALMIPMCLAPIGSALSLDRVISVRKYKQQHGLNARPELPVSSIGFAALRLIQIQMAVLYFSSGIEKLYGDEWWYGTAPWTAMVNNETAFFPMGIFAANFWLINLLAYGTLLLELAYPFLIWVRSTRPYLLVGALCLHLGIAVFLGLYYFAALMAFGHLAFMRREWYQAAGQAWKRWIGGMAMLYDGKCGFCKRSMAWFLAFDGLSQIEAKDLHKTRTKLVTKEQADKALYTLTGNGQAFPGFDAYQHVVPRVPGLWIFIPLFYIPWLSRAVGQPVYAWVASNRKRLSGLA